MDWVELTRKYGKDTIDLIKEIDTKLGNFVSMRKFGTLYVEKTDFEMSSLPNIGVFTITFPKAPAVALAGINLLTGDYVLETTKNLRIYKLKGLDMRKLIKQAESNWACAPQSRSNFNSVPDFSIRF